MRVVAPREAQDGATPVGNKPAEFERFLRASRANGEGGQEMERVEMRGIRGNELHCDRARIVEAPGLVERRGALEGRVAWLRRPGQRGAATRSRRASRA